MSTLVRHALWLMGFVGDPCERPVTSREERRIARRYAHLSPWRSCMDWFGGFCALCWWRKVSGQHRRALAAEVERGRRLRGTMTPMRMVRGEDGRWRRAE